uniref:Slingshot N-terminal domain-containing protein n=1 Tax=Periophthalmus magnuspinnatus TaxID=409849 RepID=A0A3B4B0U7_9GOBI
MVIFFFFFLVFATLKRHFLSSSTSDEHYIFSLFCLISISESFLTVKGAALFLPRGNGSSPSAGSRFTHLRNKHAGDIQQHLQTMFTLLRPEDNIKLAVRLESVHPQITRYMVVVSTNGRQEDFSPIDR